MEVCLITPGSRSPKFFLGFWLACCLPPWLDICWPSRVHWKKYYRHIWWRVQAIPIVAIAPLLVIWLGNGILSKVVICALIVFFPVLVNTIVGVRAVPTALYDLMNSLHASRSQILWKVEVPASLPVFLGGLRIGATLSVIGAIVGELVSAQQGLGFLLQLGNFQYDTPMVFVAVFTLIALALMLYGIVTLFEKRFLKWQEKN